MSNPAVASSCGERVVAWTGWAVVAVVTVPTALLWSLLVVALWGARSDLAVTPISAAWTAAAVLSVPAIAATVVHRRAWRSPHAMACCTAVTFVLGLVLLGHMSVLAVVWSLGG